MGPLINILLIFWGMGLFVLSYSLLHKSKGDIEGLKIYSAFAYGGVVFITLGVDEISGYYVSFPLWYGSVILLLLGIAACFLIRPGFRKSDQVGLEKKNLLEILFAVVIYLSAMLLVCDLFVFRFSAIQSNIASLGLVLGITGEAGTSDIPRKAKYLYIVLLTIAGVFIMISRARFL